MKRLFNISVLFLVLAGILGSMLSCEKFPVDEDGLLITDRGECYVSNFNLLDADYQTLCLRLLEKLSRSSSPMFAMGPTLPTSNPRLTSVKTPNWIPRSQAGPISPDRR